MPQGNQNVNSDIQYLYIWIIQLVYLIQAFIQLVCENESIG